jgi:zinc protease
VSISKGVADHKSRTVGEYRTTLIRRLALSMLNGRFGDMTKKAERPFRSAYAYHYRLTPSHSRQGVNTTPFEGQTPKALTATLIELRRAQKFGFTATELDRIMRSTLSWYDNLYKERRTETSRSAAGELVRHFTTGETVPGIAAEHALVNQLFPTITLAEVNQFIGQFLADGGHLIALTIPKKAGLKPPSQSDLEAVVAQAMANDSLTPYEDVVAEGPLVAHPPQPGKVVGESKNDVFGTTEWTLSNGIRVIVKPTDFDDNNVGFDAWRWGGTSLIPDSDYVTATSAMSIAYRSGVGPFDSITLPKRLVGKQASASLRISELYVGLSGYAVLNDLDTMFELLWLRATQTRLDSDAFARYRTSQEENLRNRDANPNTEFYDTYSRLLWNDHPRSRPWTLKTLGQLDLEKSRAFVKRQTADWWGTTFVFVGKIDLARLKPLVERWIASLPAKAGTKHAYRDIKQRAAQGVHTATVRRGIAPKAKVRIRISGEFKSTPKNRYMLRSMTRVLSMRLREVLREEKGGTYSARANVNMTFHPVHTYGISISFSCEPARVDELTKTAWEIVESLKKSPADPKYTQKISAQQAREQEVDERQNSYWESAILWNSKRNETPADLMAYRTFHKSLTPAMIHKAAQRYLNTKRYVQVSLLPGEKSSKK